VLYPDANNVTLEYARRKIQGNDDLQLTALNQVRHFLCADDVNVLGENINSLQNNVEIILQTNK
jgi:hypothetical protein